MRCVGVALPLEVIADLTRIAEVEERYMAEIARRCVLAGLKIELLKLGLLPTLPTQAQNAAG